MDEKEIPNSDDSVVPPKPSPIFALGAVRFAESQQPPGNVLDVSKPSQRVIVHAVEGLHFGVGDIPEGSHRVVELMVSDGGMHLSAGGLRLGLELHEEVEHLARVRASVEHVARLHQVRLGADPVEPVVDEPRRFQVRDECAEGSVNVADGHDTIDGFELGGDGLRVQDCRPGNEEERGKDRLSRAERTIPLKDHGSVSTVSPPAGPILPPLDWHWPRLNLDIRTVPTDN